MRMRALGRTGLSIAPVVFGSNVFGWTADKDTSFQLLDAFFDSGFNAIDTADVYSSWVEGHEGGESERVIGEWLKRGSVERDKAIIVTKVGHPMWGDEKRLQEKWIIEAVENSLRRLQTDYIDLYFAHFPEEGRTDEETLGAFAKLKQQGKIRSIGCSNFSAAQLKSALAVSEKTGLPRYEVIQPEYNLYNRDTFDGPLSELCQAEEIGVISYFALAAGFLTGKYRNAEDAVGKARGGSMEKYLNDRGFAIIDALETIARDMGATPAAIAIAWIASRPGITAPIASATSVKQLDAIIAAGQLTLSADHMAQLDAAGA